MEARIPGLAVFAFLIVAATCNKASVRTYTKNKKFSCSDVDKKIYKAASEMQCIHKCLRYEKCTTINYNAADDAKENCEVFSSSSCLTTIISSHWTGIVIQVSNFSVITTIHAVFLVVKIKPFAITKFLCLFISPV